MDSEIQEAERTSDEAAEFGARYLKPRSAWVPGSPKGEVREGTGPPQGYLRLGLQPLELGGNCVCCSSPLSVVLCYATSEADIWPQSLAI